jgi:ABC-type transport system involved in multi-copper enzyme maturation permease subunit
MVLLYLMTAIAMAALARYSFGAILDRGDVVYSFWHVLGVSLLALALTMIPLLAVVGYGVMVSTLSKSLTSALGIGVGLLIAIEPIKHLVSWGDRQLSEYIPTSYLDTALSIAGQAATGVHYQWFPGGWWASDLGRGLTLSIGCLIVSLVVSYVVFLRRDLNFS